MKLTPEEAEQVTQWYENEFWPAYPGKLTRNKHGNRDNKGSRAYGLQACLKLTNIASHEERIRILGNLKAQVRYDMQDPDCTRWPMVSSYLNQKRFDDEIQSMSELRERTEHKQCRKCKQETLGPKYDLCAVHFYEEHDPHREARARSLQAMGLVQDPHETDHEYGKRCKKYLLENLLRGDTVTNIVVQRMED